MPIKELLDPILSGVVNTHFFNGRLLSAQDLQADQDANREQHRQLGRAIGDGIAWGLAVQRSADENPNPGVPMLTVDAGLALNRNGQALYLAANTNIALVPQTGVAATEAGLFAPCVPAATATLTDLGAYVLVLSPASGYEGSAPMSGLGATTAGGCCGSRFAVEGVQFNLIGLDLSRIKNLVPSVASELEALTKLSDPASLSRLRNILAHACFGTIELQASYRNPFQLDKDDRPIYATYGALDSMRDLKTLSDCDVPLALIFWTKAGVQFVDMWSVRRRVTARAITETFPVLVGARRSSEGEAMIAQFQDQLDDIRIRKPVELSKVVASEWFRFLPPIGFVPMANEKGAGGFDASFLDDIAAEGGTVEGALLRSWLHEALYHDPIDLRSRSAPVVENEPRLRITVYAIRENMAALDKGDVRQAGRLFTSATMLPRDCKPR